MNSLDQHSAEFKTPLQNSLLTLAKIAGITAILSFVGTLVGIVATLMQPPPQNIPAKEGFDEATVQQVMQSSTYLSVLVSLTISGLAFYFLIRFSTLAKSAIQNNNNFQLNKALQSLGGYFRIWGIILFFVMALFVVALLGGILGGAMGG